MSTDASSNVSAATIASNPETVRSRDASDRFNLSAALIAGVVAGGAFLLLELLASNFGAGTPMGPARATLKSFVGVAPGQLTTSGLLGTLSVHFGLSLLTTAVLARMVHSWKTYVAAIFGGVFGGFLYTANVVMTWTISPEIALGGSLAMIANYMAFGVTSALVYKYWQHRSA